MGMGAIDGNFEVIPRLVGQALEGAADGGAVVVR